MFERATQGVPRADGFRSDDFLNGASGEGDPSSEQLAEDRVGGGSATKRPSAPVRRAALLGRRAHRPAGRT